MTVGRVLDYKAEGCEFYPQGPDRDTYDRGLINNLEMNVLHLPGKQLGFCMAPMTTPVQSPGQTLK